MQSNRLQYVFFFVLLAITAWVMFLIFRPFLGAIFIAIAFSVVFQPLYKNLLRRTGGREAVASLCAVIIIVFLILVPLTFLGGLLFNEAHDLYIKGLSADPGVGVVEKITTNIERVVHNVAPQASINVEEYIRQGLRWVVSHLDSFFSGFFQVLLGTLVMILSLFYLFKDGGKLRKQLVALSPLSNVHDEKILSTLHIAINSVIKGSLTIAVVQGIIAGLGFWFFGIPNPILWGSITVLAALIPGIGTAIILIPAILYLFFVGNTFGGVGLAIWGGLAVGLIDNVLTPYVLKRGMKIHPLLILFSVLGGIAFFGPIGFLAGPVFLSFCFALLELYPLVIKESAS